ncbi:MAG: hypothetical protein RR360_07410, partial [Raoultibacter sp.]
YGSIVGMGDVRDLASDAERVASWGYYLVTPGDQDWWKVPQCPPDWAAHYSKSVTLGNTSFHLYTLVPTYPSGRSSTQTQTFAPADSKLENGVAFTFNLNFAAAVTTNVDEAATWGGDPVEGGIPWQVRHADQMIMNLSTKSAKKAYLNNSFLQTHDIEWGDRTKPDASSLPGDFTGNYTSATFGAAPRGPVGPGVDSYAINGFEPGSVNSRNALGLFPKAHTATFKNIKLVGVQSVNALYVSTNENNLILGLLVGQATNCVFDNCEV